MPGPKSKVQQCGPVIIEQIAKCAGIEAASAIAGVASITVRKWLRDGRALLAEHGTDWDAMGKRAEYARFAHDYLEADGKMEASLLEVNYRAALDEGDVKAAQWLLERRHPTRYNERIKHHLEALFEAVRNNTDAETFERICSEASGETSLTATP